MIFVEPLKITLKAGVFEIQFLAYKIKRIQEN